MHETYRMLGREHEADLEREARRRDLAAAAQREGRRARTPRTRPKVVVLASIAVAAAIQYLTRARIIGTALSKARRAARKIGAPSDVAPARRP